MQLYIVYYDHDCEGSEVIGIFDTIEQAIRVRDNVTLYGSSTVYNKTYIETATLNNILGEPGKFEVL